MIWSHLVFFKWARRKKIGSKLMERGNGLEVKREEMPGARKGGEL